MAAARHRVAPVGQIEVLQAAPVRIGRRTRGPVHTETANRRMHPRHRSRPNRSFRRNRNPLRTDPDRSHPARTTTDLCPPRKWDIQKRSIRKDRFRHSSTPSGDDDGRDPDPDRAETAAHDRQPRRIAGTAYSSAPANPRSASFPAAARSADRLAETPLAPATRIRRDGIPLAHASQTRRKILPKNGAPARKTRGGPRLRGLQIRRAPHRVAPARGAPAFLPASRLRPDFSHPHSTPDSV